ncbi:MAG: TonB-dependent receptor [Bacteroidota bacterium]|nr:TonB-dependent receptor [Bacteroidota bacterium]
MHVLLAAVGYGVFVLVGAAQQGERRIDTVRVYRLPGVQVLGEESRTGTAGSFVWITPQRYEELHAVSLEEILRTVPGVHVQAEDGMGLRVNIGIRGLPPTRSGKVLVLEDGIPIAPAPYGYSGLYYHPPMERFRGVEVVKGGAQVLYGPHTVGGVINYVTPVLAQGRQLHVRAVGGTRRYGSFYALYGQQTEQGDGFLLDGLYKQGQLNRENTGTRVGDVALKAWLRPAEGQRLLLKVNLYDEVSQATYAGLTLAQFQENPFQNPFVHDTFFVERYSGQVRWELELPQGSFSVTGYGAYLQRDWWRQGSLVRQRTPDGRDTLVSADNSADPGNDEGVRAIPDPNRADGRLRQYWFAGAEGQWLHTFQTGSLEHRLRAGLRLHGERQHRYQIRARSAIGRTGTIVEDNWRWGLAGGAFVQGQTLWRQWSATTGLRAERIQYRRLNALANNGVGVAGETQLWAVIPAFGLTYTPATAWTFFFGVHAGFAPPRVEDVIDNDGGVTELEPERSWNWELGIRARPLPGLTAELTTFRLDFRNQIIPATLAGGVTSVLTNAGQTLHQGIELMVDADAESLLGLGGVRCIGSATWLPIARYEGERYSVLSPSVRITGNRLPYAPEYQLSLTLQWKPWQWLLLQVVTTSVGEQFADDLNTVEPTPNGRQGRLAPYTVVDGTVEWRLREWKLNIVLTAKNLFNRLYITDRSRGILPGMPSTVQLGVEWEL